MKVSDADVDRVAHALQDTPTAAYTTPVVYPWAVQNFEKRPMADRAEPAEGCRLYLHVPFCLYHCTFCFYAVRCGSGRPEMERYLAALFREMALFESGRSLSRLTVGGGTPTALPPDLLDNLFAEIGSRTVLPPASKRKMEASPDSLTQDHIDVLKKHDLDWVSLGVESLEEPVLDTVTRQHTTGDAFEACRLVTENGLNLNVDLIYGLPGQSEQSFRRDLEAVAETGARTLCLYALRLNEKTRVAKQLDDKERMNLARLMRWRAFVKQAAKELGFEQTRCYTFERRDVEARSLKRSSTGVPGSAREELALGMSARSQLGGVVYRNHAGFKTYLERIERNASPVETLFELDDNDRRTQLIAGTLGAGKRLDRALYEDMFEASIDVDFAPVLKRLRSAGLIQDDGGGLELSELGRLVYDRIILCFYSQRARGWVENLPPPRKARG